jgi:hypothetical protein
VLLIRHNVAYDQCASGEPQPQLSAWRLARCREGWYADLTHPGTVTTRYCHMQTKPWVDVGDLVIAGQPIGTIGSTGHSSGPHLHYEVHAGGRSTDPQPWMDDHGAPLGTPPTTNAAALISHAPRHSRRGGSGRRTVAARGTSRWRSRV